MKKNYGFLGTLTFGGAIALAVGIPVLLTGLGVVLKSWQTLFFAPKDSTPLWIYFALGAVILVLLKNRD